MYFDTHTVLYDSNSHWKTHILKVYQITHQFRHKLSHSCQYTCNNAGNLGQEALDRSDRHTFSFILEACDDVLNLQEERRKRVYLVSLADSHLILYLQSRPALLLFQHPYWQDTELTQPTKAAQQKRSCKWSWHGVYFCCMPCAEFSRKCKHNVLYIIWDF